MSGPEPTLAATAAFGRMSSQLSLSTRTCTPVASVKRLVLAIHASSSPWTKGDQRSSRSVAPASGVYVGASWAKAGVPSEAGCRPRPRRPRQSCVSHRVW